jgi:hypothetical protein
MTLIVLSTRHFATRDIRVHVCYARLWFMHADCCTSVTCIRILMRLCASARTTVQLAYCIHAWLWVCVLVASFHVKHCDRLLPCGRLFLCFALGGLRRRLLLSCSPSRAERSAAPAQHSTTTTGPGPSTTIDTGTTACGRMPQGLMNTQGGVQLLRRQAQRSPERVLDRPRPLPQRGRVVIHLPREREQMGALDYPHELKEITDARAPPGAIGRLLRGIRQAAGIFALLHCSGEHVAQHTRRQRTHAHTR